MKAHTTAASVCLALTIWPALAAHAEVAVGASAFTAEPVGALGTSSSPLVSGILSASVRSAGSRWAFGVLGEQNQRTIVDLDSSDLTTRAAGVQVDYSVGLNDDQSARAYGGLGAGYASVHYELGGLAPRAATTSGFFVAPEVGLRVDMTKHVFLAAAVRYQHVQIFDSYAWPTGRTNTLGGLGFRWQIGVAF